MKKGSCAGNRVSDLLNQNSFVRIHIWFAKNPTGNGNQCYPHKSAPQEMSIFEDIIT